MFASKLCILVLVHGGYGIKAVLTILAKISWLQSKLYWLIIQLVLFCTTHQQLMYVSYMTGFLSYFCLPTFSIYKLLYSPLPPQVLIYAVTDTQCNFCCQWCPICPLPPCTFAAKLPFHAGTQKGRELSEQNHTAKYISLQMLGMLCLSLTLVDLTDMYFLKAVQAKTGRVMFPSMTPKDNLLD